MVDSWLRAPLFRPSSSRRTVFQRCHVLSRRGCRARLGGQIAKSLHASALATQPSVHLLTPRPSLLSGTTRFSKALQGAWCPVMRPHNGRHLPLNKLEVLQDSAQCSCLAGSKAGALAMMWPPAAAALLGKRLCRPSRHSEASAPRAFMLLLASKGAPGHLMQQCQLQQPETQLTL